MIISFFIISNVKSEHLRIFDVILYSLSIIGFTNSSDGQKKGILAQNNKLFWKYGLILLLGNIIIIKVIDIILFFNLYRENSNIETGRRNIIVISYYAILSFNIIYTTLFGFNYIRFYRKSFYNNFLFLHFFNYTFFININRFIFYWKWL